MAAASRDPGDPGPSPDQVPENWSAIASRYEEAFEGLSVQFAEDAIRLVGLKPGERVLDVAAGTGAFSLLAARAGVACMNAPVAGSGDGVPVLAVEACIGIGRV